MRRAATILALTAVFLVGVGAAIAIVNDTNASLWATLEQSSMWRTYSRQNPNESARVKSYWLNGGAKPAVATKFGEFLVEVNEDRTTTQPPPPPPPTDTTTTTPPPPPPPGTFPSAANTGVPAGTTLTQYTGPGTITAANTVINGKTIGCLKVSAPGVVIRNSRLVCNAFYALETSGTLLIEDTEIDCQGSNGTGLADSNITARRLNIHGCENGMSVNHNVLVEDSYIHDLFNGNGSHLDGIQFDPFISADNITIRHNTIYGMDPQGQFGTSAIIDHSFNANSNVLIDNNLMAGGAFTLYCSIGFTGTNYRVTNNKFSTKFKSTVGFYGPSSDCGDQTQSGNVIYETGAALHLG